MFRAVSFFIILAVLSIASTAQSKFELQPVSPEGGSITLTAPTTTKGQGVTFTIPITLDDVTGQGITAFQFDVLFDPNVIDPSGANFGCSAPGGTLAGNAGLLVFCNIPGGDPTRLKIASFGFGGQLTGAGTLMNIQFTVDAGAVPGNVSPLTFFFGASDGFFSNGFPTPPGIPRIQVNGQVTIVGPTAAPVGIQGRVLSPFGLPVRNAYVSLMNGNGQISYAVSNTFGYYRFSGVASGETYFLSARAKGMTFATQAVNVTDSIQGLDLIAEP